MSDPREEELVPDLDGVTEDSVPKPEKKIDPKNYDDTPVGPAEGYVPESEEQK